MWWLGIAGILTHSPSYLMPQKSHLMGGIISSYGLNHIKLMAVIMACVYHSYSTKLVTGIIFDNNGSY